MRTVVLAEQAFLDEPLVLVGIALGALGVVLGVLVRAGRARIAFTLYEYEAMPEYTRNAPFTFVPGGLAILLGVTAAELTRRGIDLAAAIVTILFVVALGVTIWWAFRPPEWMKPGWLRSYGQSGRYRQDDDNELTRLPVPRLMYFGLWISWVILLVLWFVFDWSLALLAGLAFGAAFVLALTPYPGQPPPATRLLKEILGDRIPKDG